MASTSDHGATPALLRLRKAIADQRQELVPYEKPSEPIAFECLRAIDDLYCRDLMTPDEPIDDDEKRFRRLSTWGINHALRRVIPRERKSQPFRLFPSREGIQTRVDDFLFDCARLALAERFEGWLTEGVLIGDLRHHPKLEDVGTQDVLVLRYATTSCSDEEIGRLGLEWAGNARMAEDAETEKALEQRYEASRNDLLNRAELFDGWRMSYTSTPEIDEMFVEWARIYLRRKFSQDMIGLDDSIGGRPFSRYIEVLTALSGWAQKHLAFAAILLGRRDSPHIRNLLTAYSYRPSFIESLARYLDGDANEVESILACFVLGGDNLDVHTAGAEPAWAPIVQASADTLILPMYGLDINPYLFLLSELRARHEADWFRIANNRERRWIDELRALFGGPRWHTHGGNLQLRQDGKVITDIDFALLDGSTNELALFQLKWQHPVGIDNRGRRSSGRNLVTESNRWVDSVTSWIARHGVQELMRRLGFRAAVSPTVHLFVLGRYHVHLTGFDQRDKRASWSDWAHFQKVRIEGPQSATLTEIVANLHTVIDESRRKKTGESLMLPVGGLGIVLNPSSFPGKT